MKFTAIASWTMLPCISTVCLRRMRSQHYGLLADVVRPKHYKSVTESKEKRACVRERQRCQCTSQWGALIASQRMCSFTVTIKRFFATAALALQYNPGAQPPNLSYLVLRM